MGAYKPNQIVWLYDGVVCLDISTPKYPNTCVFFEEADLPLILDGGRRWGVQKNRIFYAARGTDGNLELMHRTLLGIVDPKVMVDHEDHDGLNNRRRNIRPASTAENNRNRTSQRGSTSRFLGVCWSKLHSKWRARRYHPEGRVHLGLFDDEEAAARAYDAECLRQGDTFANLNFPEARAA